MRWRRLIMVGLLVPALMLMSGCFRVEVGFEILDRQRTRVTATETVLKPVDPSVTPDSHFGPVRNAAELCAYMAESVRDLVNGEATSTPFEDEKHFGCTVIWTQQASVEFWPRGQVTTKDRLVEFMFRHSVVDLMGDIYEKNPGTFIVSVTVPGKVLSHNGSGTVTGNTVTWVNPHEFFEVDGLQATGRLPLTWRDFILPGVIVGVLLIAGAATFGSMRRSRRSAGRPDSEAADVVVPEVEEIESSKPVKDFADD